MHFRRAVAEQCTCSCWPSGSRRSVFLAFDDITLEEYQPWKSPVQLQSSKPRLLTSPWARGLSRLTSKLPCFLSVIGCLVRLLLPAIFHRFRPQQCTRCLRSGLWQRCRRSCRCPTRPTCTFLRSTRHAYPLALWSCVLAK